MKAAVGQIGSAMFDHVATLARIEAMCRTASAQGVRLLVLPEAILGGYPKGLTFGAVVGSRSEAGRDQFLRYARAAVQVPGVETEQLAALCTELNLHLVLGAIERAGGTLYCTALLFTPDRGLAAKHRKLVPTASERLIWGQGDGSDMQAIDTEVGRIGMAICWENYMPLFRQHLYDQGVALYCAPTVDARDIWQVGMRHIANEGRCFVLSAAQRLVKADWPDDLRDEGGEIDGRSLIVSPFGEVLAGPLEGCGLLTAELDLNDIPRGKFDLDVAGHYRRSDIFKLKVNG